MKTIKIILLVLIIVGFVWVLSFIAEQAEPNKPADVSLEVFSDFEGNTTLKYNPNIFVVNPVDSTPTKDWALDAQENGVLLASLSLPKSYMPGTNFSEARFTVGRSSETKAVETCESAKPNNSTPGETAVVAGYGFSKFTFTGAGAGNFYETTSYRKEIGINCYVVEYTIHSTNINNYSPDLGIREFDKVKVQSELESVVESFFYGM